MRNLVITDLLAHAAIGQIEWNLMSLLWDKELNNFRPAPEHWPIGEDGYLNAKMVTREFLEERTDEELLGFLDDDACLRHR